MNLSVIPKRAVRSLLKGVLIYTAIYSFAIFIVYIAKQPFKIIDVISTLKLGSLITLIVVSGEIAKGVDRDKKDIRRINYLIIFITIFIGIFQFLKLIGFDGSNTQVNPNFQYYLSRIIDWMLYISTAPIFLYALLDVYIAYFRTDSTDHEKLVAKFYIIFVDFVCVVPLLIVITLSIFYILLGNSRDLIDYVFGGSVAIIIIASAIAAKAVDELEEIFEEYAETETGKHV